MAELLPTADDVLLLLQGVAPAAAMMLVAMVVGAPWLRSLLCATAPAAAIYGVRTMTNGWPAPDSVGSADQRMVWASVYWAALVGLATLPGSASQGSEGTRDGRASWPITLLTTLLVPLAGLVGALGWVLHPFLDRGPDDPTAVTWGGILSAAVVVMALGAAGAGAVRVPSAGNPSKAPRFDLRRGAAPLALHIALSALGMLLVMFRTASLGQLLAGLGVLTAFTAGFAVVLPARKSMAPVHGAVLVGAAGIVGVGCRPLLSPAPPLPAMLLCAGAALAPMVLRLRWVASRPHWQGALMVLGLAAAVAVVGLVLGHAEMPEADPYGYGR